MKNQKGFSLIELLIVVVIIGIIAAIAIPNLLAARRASNEAAAASTMRTMNSAQATCQATNAGTAAGDYCTSAQLQTAKLMDTTFSDLTGAADRGGYKYTLALVGTKAYDFAAAPTSTSTGTNYYGTTEAGVIYVDRSPAAITFSATTRQPTATTAVPIQ